MYANFRPPQQPVAYDWSRATERAIDLSIESGLFLAPRRVLLQMAAELKRESQVVRMPRRPEELEERKAA